MKTYDEMIKQAAENLCSITGFDPDTKTAYRREGKCEGYEMAIAEIFDVEYSKVSKTVFQLAKKMMEESPDRRAINRWTSYWGY